MMRYRVFLAAILMLGTGFLFFQPVSTTAQDETPGLLIVAGDSVAAGIGSSLPRKRGFAALIRDWMNAGDGRDSVLANLARPGESVESFAEDGQFEEILTEIELARMADSSIEAVVLSLGGNDLLALEGAGLSDREEQLSTTRDALEQIVGEIRTQINVETPIVLLNYYDPTGGDPTLRFSDSWWIVQFNQMIDEIAQVHDARVADVYSTIAAGPSDLTRYPSDIHPTNQGYLAIARTILQALNFNQAAPVVTILEPEVVGRETPTVRFRIESAVDIQRVSVSTDPGVSFSPVPLGSGEYVSLLDLTGTTGNNVTVEVEVEDVTGTTSSASKQLQRMSPSNQESSP